MVADQVKHHFLLRRVDEPLRTEILSRAHLVDVARGETVYDRHRFLRCLGIVLRGRIQVCKDNLLVSTLLEGDVFGAAALFNGNPDFPTTMRALAPCQVLLIPQLDTVSAGSAERKLAQYLLEVGGGTDEVTTSATRLSALIGVGRASLYRAFEELEQEGAILREGKLIRILDRKKLQI